MAKNSVILRIDDRLIHGQVLVGWGSNFGIKHFVVGNDRIAENEWEKNLLLMAAPPDFDARVLTLSKSIEYIHEHLGTKEYRMVLVNSPEDIMTMSEKGLRLKKVNVGGVHFSEGRKEFLSYLYLSNDEVQIFKELIGRGFYFECQDVPSGTKYNLEKILEKQK